MRLGLLFRCGDWPNPIGPHRPRDVLQRLLADILKCEPDPSDSIFLNPLGDADPAGFGDAFQTRSDVDPVPEDVVVVENDIALMDANPELDAPIRRLVWIALGHRGLHFAGAAQRIDDAAEFNQQTIAGGFDEAAAMRRDLRFDKTGQDSLDPA